MTRKALVYTELQISVPFDQAPWSDINADIRKQPGFINKTWLSGVGSQSLGGLYEFDSLDNAKLFVTDYFPGEAAKFGVAQMTRLFDGGPIEAASRDINSVHFGAIFPEAPAAYVYTEVQISVPFETFPWQDRNVALKSVPGLLGKTWLSGLNTQTLGGFDAFDSIDNAQDFALRAFPKTPAKLGAAFLTRVFDAELTEAASRDMRSPFYR